MTVLECTPTTIYTIFPCGIDGSDQLPIAVDNVTPVKGEVINRLRDSTIAIESELGIQPSGTYTTVRARLDDIDAILQTIITGGGGTISAILKDGALIRAQVTGINFIGSGVAVVSSPTVGQVDVTVSGNQTLATTLSFGKTTNGHNIIISSGDSITGSVGVSGGTLSLTSGAATNGSGGLINVAASNAVTSGTGGAIEITSGNGAGNGSGGIIGLSSGSGSGTGAGGDLVLMSGSGGVTNASSGNVIIIPGTKSGGGTQGVVEITGVGSALRLDSLASRPINPGSGHGLLWLKSDNPTTLYFTDSSNTDHQIDIGTPFSAGGDLSGTNTSQTVIGLQTVAVSSTAPTNDYVLAYNSTSNKWEPSPRNGITVSTFVATTNLLEVDQTIVTPAFTATYTVVPTTAALTDNVGSPSKNVIGSPGSFTSNGTFQKTSFGQSVVFTISVTVGSSSASKNVSITWGQKNYWGVGAAGQTGGLFIVSLATSAVAISRNASASFNASSVQKIYYATRSAYGTPTFKDAATGFGFAITKSGDFSVTNGFGFSENYQLWESDNLGLGTITMDVT